MAVTGVKDVAAVVAVRVFVAMASVVPRTEATSSENVFDAVADVASVTVTVKVSEAPLTVGVPVMAPVEVFIDNPDGRDGETE